jgi:hypothetical protein
MVMGYSPHLKSFQEAAQRTFKRIFENHHPNTVTNAYALVLIDLKEHRVENRRHWAHSHRTEMQALASLLSSTYGVPVLVEFLLTNICMGTHLATYVFNKFDWKTFDKADPMFKNTAAYQWGFVRLSACARYIVHLDSDVSLASV